MAITLLQQPEKFQPVYNPIVFLFSSTNVAQANFKYVYDIYAGDGTTLILRIKQSARPTDGYGLIDLHRVLENYVNVSAYDISTTTYGFQKNTNSYKSYLLKVGEEYGSTPVVYANSYTGTKKYAFNSCLDPLDFVDYAQSTYLLTNTSATRFLTNQPISNTAFARKIKITESAWFHFITDTAAAATEMNFTSYDSNLSILKSCTISNSFAALSDDDSRFLRVSVGPENINLIPSGSITGASQPLIPSNTALYVLSITSATNTSSQVARFYIDTDCTVHTDYRLHFLNKLGGFDSFTFTQASEDSYQSIERQSYKRILGSVSGSAWAVSKSDRQDITYNVKSKKTTRISSNWITEAESTWLKELVMSPVIYLQSGTDLIPVSITDNSYVLNKKINKPLFNLELTISYTDVNSQRG